MPFTAPSSPPSSFETSATGSTSIFLSWAHPPAQHQNGIIRQYVIELHAASSATTTTTIISTGMNATITNLRPYTVYECTIAAETVSVGIFSSIQLIRTQEAGEHVIPKSLTNHITLMLNSHHYSSVSSPRGARGTCGKPNCSSDGMAPTQR